MATGAGTKTNGLDDDGIREVGINDQCCCCWVAQSCPTLRDPMDCSTPGFPVLHHLPELAPTHVHWVGDAIQPSHPLLPPSPPAFNLSQHQGLFLRLGSLHQVAKVLELQLQHQSPDEYSGLISFRNDGSDLLAVQGALKSLGLNRCWVDSIPSIFPGWPDADSEGS